MKAGGAQELSTQPTPNDKLQALLTPMGGLTFSEWMGVEWDKVGGSRRWEGGGTLVGM